jgi:hypothetical protein
VNWTGFISKFSWNTCIQGTITALRGNNWRKIWKPLRIWRIRAGMSTGTSRTQVQSATDTPQTLRQNPSCTNSFWLRKLAWLGSESGPLSDIFLSWLRPAKKTLILVEQKMCKSYGYSSLHIKVVTTGLCLVSILPVFGSRNTQDLHR